MRLIKIGIALAVVVAAISVFAYTLITALWYNPPGEEAPPPAVIPAGTVSRALYPSRLLIPSLNIDASVQQTGLNKKGSMGVPTNFTDVAWYKYGSVPGQEGSAVIDGHVDNGLALDGVFKHLNDIKPGADIYIETKNGNKLHFVVQDIQSYPYTDAPTALIFNRGGAAWLNLITCQGDWVPDKRTYDERFVVFSRLARS